MCCSNISPGATFAQAQAPREIAKKAADPVADGNKNGIPDLHEKNGIKAAVKAPGTGLLLDRLA